MGQISCGCTQQSPGPACRRGIFLFETANLASQGFVDGITTEEPWAPSTRAHLAYMDHLSGWGEKDVKVQRKGDGWTLSVRSCGRWIFHFGTLDESFVHEWLSLRGYEQFVRGGEPTTGCLSGYYRKGNEHLPHEYMEKLARQGVPSDTPLSPSQSDLKTQVVVHIALLVATIPYRPTRAEHLLIQRRATALLRTHGIQTGPSDEQAVRELIDEAVRQKEGMHGFPVQNTLEHQR